MRLVCALGLAILTQPDQQVTALRLRPIPESTAILLRDEEDENIQIENIYGIPSEQEKLKIQAKKLAKQKKEAISKQKKSYEDALNDFSKKLKEADFDKAMKIKNELIEHGESKEELEKSKVHTYDLYKKQF